MSTAPLTSGTTKEIAACLRAIQQVDRPAALGHARRLAGGDDRAARMIGARLLYLLRLYQEAIDCLKRHIEDNPKDRYAHRLIFSQLERLHFHQETDLALQKLLEVSQDAKVQTAAALHYKGTGRPLAAVSHLENALTAIPGDARLNLLLLEAAVEARHSESTQHAATLALGQDHSKWIEIIDHLFEVGAFEQIASEGECRGNTADGLAVRAQLQLYQGAYAEARQTAERALALQPDLERPFAVMVGAAVATGDLERASQLLEGWNGERSVSLRTWQAELQTRRGQFAAAEQELTRLQNEITGYFPAKLLWVIVKDELEHQPWITQSAFDGLLEGQLAALGVDIDVSSGRVSGADLRAAAESGLARLRGNRSPFPTVVSNGRLHAVAVPPSPRHRVREAQHSTPWAGIEAARKEIAQELSQLGDHPIAACYDAELDLWVGDYETARAKFESILAAARRTTWAWIGLGASQTLLGDAGQGLETLDEGVRVMGWRGATLPIYRGESLLRLGRLDEAAEELEQACTIHPSRTSAWALRAITEHTRSNREGGQAAFDELDLRAAALLSDAARTLDNEGWWPKRPEPDFQVQICEQALVLMKGNRSSSCAFWQAPGSNTIRSLLHHRPVTSAEWEKHEIRSLERLLPGPSTDRR